MPSLRRPVHAALVVAAVWGVYAAAAWLATGLGPIEALLRRDALYYAEIATHGYSLEAGTSAFHPLYPLLAAGLAWPLGGRIGAALLVVSILSTIALVVGLSRYVAEVHGPRVGEAAGWCVLSTPPGVVWLLPYTEALFAALAVGSLWAMHRRRFWAAAALAALATLTRQPGVALALPLVWSLWRVRPRPRVAWLSPLLIPAAYAGFVAYRVLALGDDPTLISAAAHQIAPGQRIAWPWEPLIDQVAIYLDDPTQLHMLLDLGLGAGLIGLLAAGWRELSRDERLLSAALLTLALCYYNGTIAPYMALPRHVMVAFPVFIVAARLINTSNLRHVLAAVGLGLNVTLVILYATMRWIP